MGANKFTDEEVVHMLELIKETPGFHTTNMQEKLMIYVEIAGKMQAVHNTHRRTGSQVRHKFELMEQAYRKVKVNSKGSRSRHAIKYFKMLDDIFKEQPNPTKERKRLSRKIKIDTEIEEKEADPLLVCDSLAIKEELCEENGNQDQETTDPSNDELEKEEHELNEEINNANQNHESYNEEDKKNLEKIKRNFITDLVKSERDLVDSIKELDKKYTRNCKHHSKCKEAILKKDRQEIEMILEKDRKEMLKMFDAVLEALKKPSTPANLDESDDDDLLPLAVMAKRRKNI